MTEEAVNSIVELAEQANSRAIEIDKDLPITALLIRQDQKIHVINHQDFEPRPVRVEGNRALYTLDDFLQYVALHKECGGDSAEEQPWNPHIFLKRDALLVQCVFDHPEGDLAAHQKATAAHQLVWSKEINPWMAQADKWISQTAFAEWIEDHELEFMNPVSSVMLALAQEFEASQSTQFSSKFNRSTGESSLVYKLANNETGTVKVPDEFEVALPIFKGGEVYKLPLRLRYRVKDGSVAFLFRFKNLDRVVDDAWKNLVATVRAANLCPTFEVA